MKTYKITVNGVSYEVSVEEISQPAVSSESREPVQARIVNEQPQSRPQTPAPAPAAAPAQNTNNPEAKPAANIAAAHGEAICAPMPGTIVELLVKEGDSVEAGQALLVLEAMKMANEIVAEHAGTITSILIAEGSMVNAGDALICF